VLDRILGWVASKTRFGAVAELGDIVGPLLQAEELIVLDPSLEKMLPVRYEALRTRVTETFGSDLVGEVAATNAIGTLTIEQHARALVQRYAAGGGGSDRWVSELMSESVQASERARELFFKEPEI
jgi:hypothetical protein